MLCIGYNVDNILENILFLLSFLPQNPIFTHYYSLRGGESWLLILAYDDKAAILFCQEFHSSKRKMNFHFKLYKRGFWLLSLRLRPTRRWSSKVFLNAFPPQSYFYWQHLAFICIRVWVARVPYPSTGTGSSWISGWSESVFAIRLQTFVQVKAIYYTQV